MHVHMHAHTQMREESRAVRNEWAWDGGDSFGEAFE